MSVTTNTTKGRRKLPFTGFLVKTGKILTSVLVTMLGLLFVTFVIGRVMPLDPTLAIVGESASKQTYEEAYRSLGLDKPLAVQFFYYVSDVVRGDFGKSSRTGFPVINDIKRVFPATMELATIGTLIGVLFGIPLGIVAAVNRGKWIDQIARVLALIGYSMPVFWLGLIGLLIFFGILGWVGGPGRLDIFYVDIVPPVTGMILVDSLLAGEWTIFQNAISHIILPASLLGYYSLAYISRMTRSFMLEQLSAEYITTARVKGMSERAVIWKHAFGNIKVQLITVVALSYAGLLEGSVLTEIIFSWPGIGQYITTSLLAADMNAVMGGTVVVGLVFVLLNIFADLLYKFFDPRAK
ncbi:ABC transporter, permease protein 1 (cluster 5, nickel/peptides/opines) [hydrothermal vent metagenome]|uniref:ABC transporter, permease protein 1 (Cluster 5, nickel/peptides/opines) n=1 Tax=hydrothermal vent metagenome TaxID=652676 RepID=A0A3B0TNI1_9ZZZZ